MCSGSSLGGEGSTPGCVTPGTQLAPQLQLLLCMCHTTYCRHPTHTADSFDCEVRRALCSQAMLCLLLRAQPHAQAAPMHHAPGKGLDKHKIQA